MGDAPLPLTSSEVSRYSRQLLLPPPFGGPAALRSLLSSHLLVVGAGGLASPLLLYLAAAGVGAGEGSVTLVDGDRVDASNLHRQIAHTQAGADATPKQLKVDSAKERMRALNPAVRVATIAEDLTPGNAAGLVGNFLAGVPPEAACAIVDCSDK